MKKIIVLTAILLAPLNSFASDVLLRRPMINATAADTIITKTIYYDFLSIDSIAMNGIEKEEERKVEDGSTRFRPVHADVVSFFERFSQIDTNYIEPQHYNYAAMIQNTNTYEVYRISNKKGYSVTFAPEWSYKIGPYFGWRWIFLGYTLDINHIDLNGDDKQRQEFDVSLYTNLFGIDLYYRKSGDDYKIKRSHLGDGVDTKPLKGEPFHGFRSSVKGFNIYYILNHHKFSYPAAFSQSTVQRRSAGSPLLGFAYTVHKISIDWTQLQKIIDEKIPDQDFVSPVLPERQSFNMKYADVSLSAGYGYNWVFAKNCLLSISMSAALAYKYSKGGDDETLTMKPKFSFHNFGFDGIGRFGLVWNNTKWYAGVNSTLNMFNYNKSEVSLNTVFGNLNFYFGLNFGRKKE